jgi:hypothetical protein
MMETWQHKPVIVNPDLRNDPLQMQGKIGYIATANLGKDDFFVDFERGITGLYSASALLVLRSHHAIYKALMSRLQQLDKSEFKDLMRVSMLLQSTGTQHNALEALELVRSNPKLLILATQSLQELIDLSPRADRDQFNGMGR